MRSALKQSFTTKTDCSLPTVLGGAACFVVYIDTIELRGEHSMIIQMTESVQASIIAVQAYRKWVRAHKVATIGADTHWDEDDDGVVASYWQLIRPEGTDKSDACLMAALSYPIEDTVNTESYELPHRFCFGW